MNLKLLSLPAKLFVGDTMFFYTMRQSSEVREVQEWIVNQNGGPQKYFDTNDCIAKWWQKPDTKKPEEKKPAAKSKRQPDDQLELWKF